MVTGWWLLLLVTPPAPAPPPPREPADPPLVTVDRDNVEIRESCRLRVGSEPIIDADGNGVIHITADDVTVTFEDSVLRGAGQIQSPDTFTGIGIRITGENVTLRDATVRGYKVAVHAREAHGLMVEGGTLSGNYRQRLGSTPDAEDSGDWLWPHRNDENQWFANYGAALYVEDADRVTIRDLTVRAGQNGIILDRVNESRIYDNDCSFLSGWGLAMWRSSRNVVTRNAFDFCVRGYSHGVYNRGQDSAGILLFEQCHDNLFAENSATHCGDGFFAFAGKEALGELNPREDLSWYERRGHTGNRIINNDFSFAVAHGIELTFSFDNEIYSNRLVGNGICGIWGGYSQDIKIAGNTFEANGDMAYGLERGGINIEHGHHNTIASNAFRNNACGIHLWWDDDAALLETPWAKANEREKAGDTIIHHNSFEGDAIAIQVRDIDGTLVASNTFERVGRDVSSENGGVKEVMVTTHAYRMPEYEVHGLTRPLGARGHLAGREHVIIDEWGPHDWRRPLLHFVRVEPAVTGGRVLEYRMLGVETMPEIEVTTEPTSTTSVVPFHDAVTGAVQRVRIYLPESDSGGGSRGGGGVHLVDVAWRFGESDWNHDRRTVVDATWTVRQFASPVDPREDVEQWRTAAASAAARPVAALDFPYGGEGPKGLDRADHFGTVAHTTLTVPAGSWRIRSLSDDGIRVWMDDELVIDDWTWHAPKRHEHVFALDAPRTIELRVEHFELDGHAVLRVDLEPVR